MMVPTALRVPRYSRHMTQSTVEPLTDPPARVYRSGTTASFMDALTALYIFALAMAPISQGLESPANPGRFTLAQRMGAEAARRVRSEMSQDEVLNRVIGAYRRLMS